MTPQLATFARGPRAAATRIQGGVFVGDAMAEGERIAEEVDGARRPGVGGNGLAALIIEPIGDVKATFDRMMARRARDRDPSVQRVRPVDTVAGAGIPLEGVVTGYPLVERDDRPFGKQHHHRQRGHQSERPDQVLPSFPANVPEREDHDCGGQGVEQEQVDDPREGQH